MTANGFLWRPHFAGGPIAVEVVGNMTAPMTWREYERHVSRDPYDDDDDDDDDDDRRRDDEDEDE